MVHAIAYRVDGNAWDRVNYAFIMPVRELQSFIDSFIQMTALNVSLHCEWLSHAITSTIPRATSVWRVFDKHHISEELIQFDRWQHCYATLLNSRSSTSEDNPVRKRSSPAHRPRIVRVYFSTCKRIPRLESHEVADAT